MSGECIDCGSGICVCNEVAYENEQEGIICSFVSSEAYERVVECNKKLRECVEFYAYNAFYTTEGRYGRSYQDYNIHLDGDDVEGAGKYQSGGRSARKCLEEIDERTKKS